MFEGEKTYVFWTGLIILGLASVSLFTIIWFNLIYPPYGRIPHFLTTVPFIVGTVVFILIGLYMMKSGVKERPVTEMAYCSYCGTRNIKDAVYCKKCGKKIS